MDNILDLTADAQDGRIDWTPPAFHKPSVGTSYGVALNLHRVGTFGSEHAFQGRSKVYHAVGIRVLSIIREDFEQWAANLLLSSCAGYAKSFVIGGNYRPTRRSNDEQGGRRCIEERA